MGMTQEPWTGSETITLAELAQEMGASLAESVFANIRERRTGRANLKPYPEAVFLPARKRANQ